MPPRSSEILDSEDDDEELVINPSLPALVATVTSGEDTKVQLDSSTEEQLRRAHLDLMAPTQHEVPIVNFSDLAATSAAASPLTTKKRILPDTDPQPPSSGKLKRIKIVSNPESHDFSPTCAPETPVPPFDGTSDTIPGPTLPSLTALDGTTEKKTPRPRRSTSSQHNHSSADQSNSLTPWSGTALASSDRNNSDDAAIGLPKEMYQPRPSRSRSAAVDTAQFDFTKTVEQAGKKSRPRRSVTDTENVTSAPIFPQNPILQAPAFERLSPTPDSQAYQTSMHVNSTVPESIPELSSPTKSSKASKKAAASTKQPAKRGRPKKKVVEDEEDELAPQHDLDTPRSQQPRSAHKTEVQVVIESKQDPGLAATVLAALRQHKSRDPSPKVLHESSHASEQIRTKSIDTIKVEPAPQSDDESDDEVVKPRSTARTRANAKPKAKSITPEPSDKDDNADSEDEEESVDERVKPKAKSKAKAKPQPKGKAAKPEVAPIPPSDHDGDMPGPPLADDEDQESGADDQSEAEEDSEDESPKPKPKLKAKAKATAKAETKSKAIPKPKATAPKPSPPIADTPKPAAIETPAPDAAVTPKVATVKKDANSSTKPSWQQSTYRVGLSKTQRIPSLLKVFKR